MFCPTYNILFFLSKFLSHNKEKITFSRQTQTLRINQRVSLAENASLPQCNELIIEIIVSSRNILAFKYYCILPQC